MGRPIRTTRRRLHHVAGRRQGQDRSRERHSNWAQLARDNGARVESVEGFAQAIKLLNQGRVDVVINDSIAVYQYLAETGDTSVKIAAHTGAKSEQGFAARKNSGLLPELSGALKELSDDGALASISQKYLKANVSGAPDQQQTQHRSTGTLIADNLWPLAKAAITVTIPLTVIRFIIGLVIALGVALARLSSNPLLSNAARFYISLIRGTPLLVQLFIVFFALPEFGIRIDPFPAAVIAFSLNVGGYAAEIIRSSIQSIPKGQWEAAETIGMGYASSLRRIVLPQATRVAVPPLSNTLISLVRDTSLASTILVTELFRTAQKRRGADVRVLRAVRHRRRVLLGPSARTRYSRVSRSPSRKARRLPSSGLPVRARPRSCGPSMPSTCPTPG